MNTVSDRFGTFGWGKYPILQTEWRINGPIDPLAREYLQAANTSFSSQAVMGAMQAGAQLLTKYHYVRIAARQAQEIQMRPNAPLSQNAREFLASDPTLAETIAEIHERGAMPHYVGGGPTEPRSSGLPYEGAKTVLMVGEIWKV